MTQADLPAVSAGGVTMASHNDRKIACETLADDDPPAPAYYPSDFPPESYILSKDAEEDWIDHNVFIERKNSGRSSSLHSANLNPNNPTTNSGSQRYSLTVKTKPSFLGLPKPQKAAYAEAKHRRPASIRLFPPKRSASSSTNSRGGKSAVPASEPSSPKVSCIGRVRSRRDRSRRQQNRRNQAAEPKIKRSRSIKIHKKTGFWTNFRSIFSSKGHKPAKSDEPAPEPETVKKCKSVRKRDFSGLSSAAAASSFCAEPPSLGAVKRFSSGRRSDAWASDMEVDGAKSEPLDRGSIWHRRNGGAPPKEISVNRKWGSVAVGPVSV